MHRHGFTLVETIVALVLLQIAMLALAATAGVAARDLADAGARRRAHAIVAARVASLRTTACAAPSAGSLELSPGMTEHWRVDAAGALRSISDSVSLPLTRGGKGAAVARASVLCG
jgi:Tfp pilus assembly protein PilV